MSTVPPPVQAGGANEPPPIEIKSGWTTSEFGMAAAAMIPPVFAFLAILFKWSPDQAKAWQDNFAAVVGLVGSLAVAVFPAWKYISSRSHVKAQAMSSFASLHGYTSQTVQAGISPPKWRLRV